MGNIIAIDPSFAALAFSVLNADEKKVYVGKVSSPLGTKIGFDAVYHAAHNQWTQLERSLGSFGVGDKIVIDEVISEIPPPVSSFSAGLFALDTLILSNLVKRYETIQRVFIVPPSYLSTIHGTSKYKKSESTALAKYFIDEVLSDFLSVEYLPLVSETGKVSKGRLSNDLAESFLFLLRRIAGVGYLGLTNLIVGNCAGLGYEAEKVLFER